MTSDLRGGGGWPKLGRLGGFGIDMGMGGGQKFLKIQLMSFARRPLDRKTCLFAKRGWFPDKEVSFCRN